LKNNTYQERNKIARELYDSFAKDLAEVSYRLDETIGLNATNAVTRQSLRAIRASVTQLIEKSQHLREEKFELTRRERDVLAILATGASIKEIAETLFLSQPTIKTHVSNIYRKLGSANKIEAVNRARELELLPQK
jgi:ATP/maltotriose-dependent transcriptional regulator MalT